MNGGGWMVVAEIGALPSPEARRAARRIKRLVGRHQPYIRRTGNLSRSSYVQYYRSMNVIVAGARMHYAEFLNAGTSRIMAHHYIKDAILEIIPGAKVLYEDKIIT